MTSSISVPPLHQLMYIFNALNAERNVTAIKLAGEMEVCERTVKRYIKYMREELGMVILWEATSHSSYFDRPYEYLPLLRVTGEEALSLALASKTFAAWQGTALDSILTKVGSGLKRIYDMCADYPCAHPEIEADADWYRILFRRPGIATPEATPEATSEATPEVTPEVIKMLGVILGEMKRQDIQTQLGLTDEKHFREYYQQPAVTMGLIKRTIPDKQRSSKQKYRLTEKRKGTCCP